MTSRTKSPAILAALALLLTGCETTGPATECSPWRPIYVSKDDTLTDGTATQILEHNMTGRELCGW